MQQLVTVVRITQPHPDNGHQAADAPMNEGKRRSQIQCGFVAGAKIAEEFTESMHTPL